MSKNEKNLKSEVAPFKINASSGKFDVFAAPVYVLENDFKENDTNQGLGMVLNTVYNIDSKNSVKFEAEYETEPTKNIFKTKFGKLKDNCKITVGLRKKNTYFEN